MTDETEQQPSQRPDVKLPDEAIVNDVEQVENAVEAPEPFRPVVATAWSVGLALVGAAIWAGISYATDYQIGLVAIVIGVLAGIGAARGGRCRTAQYIGAGAAAFGFFAGQLMLVFALVLGGALGDVGASAADDATYEDPAETASADTGEGSAGLSDENAPFPGEEQTGVLGLIALLFWEIIKVTFTGFDVVFLGIAVWEGYRLAGPRE